MTRSQRTEGESDVQAARAALKTYWRRTTKTVGGGIILLWLVAAANTLFFGGELNALGITPRTVKGLVGIPLHPLLHAGVLHLVNNSVGLLLLGGLVILREESHFWLITATAAILGGLGVWITARPAVHVGASGIIFAYLGYLLLTGWFERRIMSILLSVGAFLMWAPLLFGVLPVRAAVSWESHFWGLLCGGVVAWVLARRGRMTEPGTRPGGR